MTSENSGELILSVLRDIQHTLAVHTRRFDDLERAITKLEIGERRHVLDSLSRDEDYRELRDRVRRLEKHLEM